MIIVSLIPVLLVTLIVLLLRRRSAMVWSVIEALLLRGRSGWLTVRHAGTFADNINDSLRVLTGSGVKGHGACEGMTSDQD